MTHDTLAGRDHRDPSPAPGDNVNLIRGVLRGEGGGPPTPSQNIPHSVQTPRQGENLTYLLAILFRNLTLRLQDLLRISQPRLILVKILPFLSEKRLGAMKLKLKCFCSC